MLSIATYTCMKSCDYYWTEHSVIHAGLIHSDEHIYNYGENYYEAYHEMYRIS